ncbi:MAG: hypothetical protein GY940_37915 [bacterium]|nr:hypothetical protein [bacterium]
MGNVENYILKLETLQSIPDREITAPHHIPVDVYIQETDILYRWSLEDKEALLAAGLSWEVVEDIPIRLGALIEADARWYVRRTEGREAERKWSERVPAAIALKNRLSRDFRYAYRGMDPLLKPLALMAKGRSHEHMVQTLNNLAVMGRGNPDRLAAINFDMSLLNDAAEMSSEMGRLLARAGVSRLEPDPVKKIRDQAYTHLKEAVDIVRLCGQYCFSQKSPRFRGYISPHLRKYRQRKKNKKTT